MDEELLVRQMPHSVEAEQAVLDKIHAAYKKGTDSIQESNDTGSPCA